MDEHEYKHLYYLKNKEHINFKTQQWRAKNRERYLANNREYQHKPNVLARRRVRYFKNRKSIRERRRVYIAKNRSWINARHRIANTRYRARNREEQKRWQSQYRRENRAMLRVRGREYYRNHEHTRNQMQCKNVMLRQQVLWHYSKGTMACMCLGCNVDMEEFLVLDHINGHRHPQFIGMPRGGSRLYLWLVQHNFPPGFGVLCHNCNFALGHYSCCPHEKEPMNRDVARLERYAEYASH